MLQFDDILKEIGEVGPYQIFVYLLICLPTVTSGIHAVISVFIAAVPKHRCAIPGWDNDTYAIQNGFHADLINRTIPIILKDGSYNDCSIFVYNASYSLADEPAGTELCDRWVYDTSVFESTAVVTMNLVCANKLYRSHITMLYMAGKLVGSFLLGSLADIFGRRLMLFLGCLLQLISGVVTGVSTDYVLLSVMRFFNGMASAGIILNGFTIGVELVGPSKRKWTGMTIMFFFALGEVILAGMAYAIRDWKYLQIAVSVPSALFISYWWLLPESPRWLISKGRNKDAIVIMERIARSNKTTVPAYVYKEADAGTEEKKSSLFEQGPNKDRLWDMFTSRVMLIRTGIIFINWTVVALSYYGLALNSGNLAGSIFLNFFLNVLVEFPAYTLCVLLLDRIGRKPLHAGMMILSGLACACSIFTVLYAADAPWTTTMLSLIGKLGSSAAFAVIYIFSAELFPTSLRNGGMGISSTVARLGSMLSPYIANLGDVVGGDLATALPLIAFGVLLFGAGLLSLLLPETLNKRLPENTEECKQFGRKETVRVPKVTEMTNF